MNNLLEQTSQVIEYAGMCYFKPFHGSNINSIDADYRIKNDPVDMDKNNVLTINNKGISPFNLKL